MVREVSRHGGTLDTFIGHGLLAHDDGGDPRSALTASHPAPTRARKRARSSGVGSRSLTRRQSSR
jgi:class 3 adenylate cyclase